jgi:phosphoglycolate phosphatase
MHTKALIFDFDLTLADSSQGIFQCVNYSLQKLGYQQVDYNTIKKLIGHSLPETFKLLTGNNIIEEANEFTTLFTKHADEVMNKNTTLFPEVFSVLPEYKKHGFQTAIVSTKYRYRIAGILDRDNASHYFDYIIGGEDVKEHKPNPEGLLLAIQKLDVQKSEVIYIGDTLIDAETAQRTGVEFIGVLSGTTTESDFRIKHSGGIIKNISELPLVVKLNGNIIYKKAL